MKQILIEQVQVSDGNHMVADLRNKVIDLNFNHPVKELFWIYQNDIVSTTNDWKNYSKTPDDDTINSKPQETAFEKFMLKFNGIDRFEPKT